MFGLGFWFSRGIWFGFWKASSRFGGWSRVTYTRGMFSWRPWFSFGPTVWWFLGVSCYYCYQQTIFRIMSTYYVWKLNVRYQQYPISKETYIFQRRPISKSCLKSLARCSGPGAWTCRSLWHYLFHPLLRLLVLCAPADFEAQISLFRTDCTRRFKFLTHTLLMPQWTFLFKYRPEIMTSFFFLSERNHEFTNSQI